MAESTSIQILKDFFGTEKQPITPKELIDLAKNDRPSYDELVALAAVSLGVTVRRDLKKA